jgi:hypothetical protein
VFSHLIGDTLDCALTWQRLIQASGDFFKLPYSRGGLHILEDRGLTRLTFHTPGRGPGHTTWYRVFLAATEGRVETIAVGVNSWNPDQAILSVGFLKEARKHHALQLQLSKCPRRPDGAFDIEHHGRMGGRSIASAVVRAALEDAGRDDLLRVDGPDGKVTILLGILPQPSRLSWRTSAVLLSNLLHYAVVRTNLREHLPYRHRRTP